MCHFNEYICANSLYGIGTISELNINFSKNEYGNVIIQGCLLLNINNSYLMAYVYISNSNQKKYYDFIRLLGLPYYLIQSIDEQPYTLSNQLIQCYHGVIKVNHKVVHTIENDTPNQIYFVGRLNPNSISLNYGVVIQNEREYISGTIQGVKLSTGEFLGLYNDKQAILPISTLNLNLECGALYSIEIRGKNNLKFDAMEFDVVSVTNLEQKYTTEYIKDSYEKYKIIQKARLNEQKR